MPHDEPVNIDVLAYRVQELENDVREIRKTDIVEARALAVAASVQANKVETAQMIQNAKAAMIAALVSAGASILIPYLLRYFVKGG